jgi:hypothetical protein
MSKTAKNDLLIAKWEIDQDPRLDLPNTMYWGDGSAATCDDYLIHRLDTHTWTHDGDGLVLQMFPEIVADVRHHHAARVWVVSGSRVTSAVLDLADADAADEHLIAELNTYPIVYRARIHRVPKGTGIESSIPRS